MTHKIHYNCQKPLASPQFRLNECNFIDDDDDVSLHKKGHFHWRLHTSATLHESLHQSGTVTVRHVWMKLSCRPDIKKYSLYDSAAWSHTIYVALNTMELHYFAKSIEAPALTGTWTLTSDS